jgi:hypothetical protein
MTNEEAKKILSGYVKACNEDDFPTLEMFEYEKVLEAMTMGAKALSIPSLPSNLDEAAENCTYCEHAYARESFKEGAEWMTGQGTIKYWMAKDKDDSLLISNFKPYRRHNGYLDVDSFKWINISPRLSRELFPNIKFEDNPVEVTIQIRKKQ